MNSRYFRDSNTALLSTMGVFLIVMIPFSMACLTKNTAYMLMTHGVETIATATAKEPDEAQKLQSKKWNGLNTYTFRYKTKDRKPQESKITILPLSKDSALTKLSVPFTTSITYDERYPEISDLTSHVPKNLSEYLWDRLWLIGAQVIFVIGGIFIFRNRLKDYRRYYSSL